MVDGAVRVLRGIEGRFRASLISVNYTTIQTRLDYFLYAEYIFCVQAKKNHFEPSSGRTVVIADDLSGAAECAAEFAQPGIPTVLRLVQTSGKDTGRILVWDLDARESTPTLSPEVLESIQHSRRTYVKIDSLLRGKWAQFIALVAQTVARPIIMCSALPRLGRGMQDGFVTLSSASGAEHKLEHYKASAIQGLMLAGVLAGHHPLGTGTEDAIGRRLWAATQLNTVTIVDAATDAELNTLARVLELLPSPYTAIGSAGLASALARCLAPPTSSCELGRVSSMAVLVGSQTEPAREQLAELAAESGETVRIWSTLSNRRAAFEPSPQGQALHLFSTQPSDSGTLGGRDLSRRFVHDALANLPPVDCFLATGGETARALCDALKVCQIDVFGQLEPGISLARMNTPVGVRRLVLKSGSFGDRGTLVRVARLGSLLSTTALERQL